MDDLVSLLGQIDILEVLDVIKPIIVFYVTYKSLKLYSLHRDYRPKNISKILLPPELTREYDEIDYEKLLQLKYGDSIVKFAKVMTEKFSPDDLVNFYNNINKLKVIVNNRKNGGGYYPVNNRIRINNKYNLEYAIFHELFHMASTILKDGVLCSGFSYSKRGPKSATGIGLNEGYTELLANRYFIYENDDFETKFSDDNFKNSIASIEYKYLMIITGRLEKIVGKEKMESLYLRASLNGLIDELKQFASDEEIMRFIANTDFIYRHLSDKNPQFVKTNKINECLKNINDFLIGCYIKKERQLYQNGIINMEDAAKNYIDFVNPLILELRVNKHLYTDKRDILDYLNGNSNFLKK